MEKGETVRKEEVKQKEPDRVAVVRGSRKREEKMNKKDLLVN